MRWQLVFVTACLSVTVSQVAHTQSGAPQPACEAACRVNPFTAPAGCDCRGTWGQPAAPAPTDPAPETNAPPPQQNPPEEPPTPTEPAAASCELACKVNPFTAPPGCKCATGITGRGGTGGGSTAPGPAITPEAIAEDGMVSVRELVDYMEQLYLARIAGVQHYYFFEQMVVAQPQQAARSRPRAGPRILLASTAQSSAAPQGGLTGINTLVPVSRNFKKEVLEDGKPTIKPVTQREVNEWRVKNDPAMAHASADERSAAEALSRDPSMFFGALGQVADMLAGKGAGDALRGEQKAMAAALKLEQQQAEEDTTAEDVLGELQELRTLLDKEAADEAAREMQAKNERQGFFDKAREASTGGRQEEVTSSVFLGFYGIEGDKVIFQRGARCANQTGCTLVEIGRYISGVHRAQGVNLNSERAPTFAMVWRPDPKALAGFGDANLGEPEPRRATLADATMAEVWFQIGNELSLISIFAAAQADGTGPAAVNLASFQDAAKSDVDRVIRMKVVLATPTNAGFSVQRIDRVYLDFRPVETGAGSPMVEPHRIREELGQWVCGEEVDVADVITADHPQYNFTWDDLLTDGADLKDPQVCAAAVPYAVVERIRTRFAYNQGFATAEAEARAIGESLGKGVEELPSDRSDSPAPPR